MTNPYYNHDSGQPAQHNRGSSSAIRAEFDAIAAAMTAISDKLDAAASASDFRLIYQGSRATDPTQRFDGSQLQDGDLYFNSSAKVMKSFISGQWLALPTASSAMTKDGGAFTGPISGTSASFSSSVTAAGFSGSGAGLTGFVVAQITSALGYTPVNVAGDTMLGQLNGTVVVLSGTATAADFIMTSDERRKQKWEKLPDDLLGQFASIKKIGTYYDRKSKIRRAGVGAQSLMKVLPEAVTEDEKGSLGVSYGNAALVIAHKLAQTVAKQAKLIEKLEKRIAKLEK